MGAGGVFFMKARKKELGMLVSRIKKAARPHEAECVLQDAVTTLLRQMPGRNEFSSYISLLAARLEKAGKMEKDTAVKLNLKAASSITNGYLNMIKKVK
jgi:hypothetical protein